MSKFKKGDRCQVIQDDSQFHAGAKVTVLQDNSEIPFCKADHISMVKDKWKEYHNGESNCISQSNLKLINTMEDKEITTKVSRVLEAHVKGCSTVKQTLEILHPECFEKKYNPKKIYAIKNDYKDIFVLHQIESGRYAFLKITSDSFHDRVFQSGEDALKAYSTIVSFDTQRDFFSWCHIVL